MKERDIFWELREDQLLALVMWAEARNESYDGIRAVGSVILNRREKNGWFGHNLYEVILKPFQFSCFNSNDPQFTKLVNMANDWSYAYAKIASLRTCHYLAEGLLDGTVKKYDDITHYHTVDCNPHWDDHMKLAFTLGNHEFYMG